MPIFVDLWSEKEQIINDDKEFKKFEVMVDETDLVFLVTSYGSIGDDNDLRAIVCRDERHFMIGRNGGVTLLANYSFGSKTTTRKISGIFNSVNSL